MLIDTHCHFNHERFATDLDVCLTRARQAGVLQMIVVGYDLTSSEHAVALAEQHQGTLFAAVAIHPHDARHWTPEAEERLTALAMHPCTVAIGEIGLDFHYDFSPREDQYRAFRDQLQMAHRLHRPVIIHCREAYPETLAILEQVSVAQIGGVMHCWAGTVEEAQRAATLGLKLGFGGTLTFKNAEAIRAAARTVPPDTLLVETDAPYLAPMPHRGQRNEPAYVPLIAQKLAELRGLHFEDIAALTTRNAQTLFPGLAGASSSESSNSPSASR
ncbi:MAG: TatD family hydrolase [Chloroherpetonaceae bacterium]|nr:TatD family hydrolase [Chthonomonadaceae bacterium]MDW8206339.1 TatD family hydrolase [Chloroherpetonaceae bacterium]